MRKIKICSIFLLIIVIFSTCSFCDDTQEETENLDIQITSSSQDEPEIYSRRAIVFERNSKTILYEKNINEKCAMASTTKIMTCILILENCNLSDEVTVSAKAASTGGSRLGLKTNDKLSVNDLLYGLMLCSGNDTAVCLAEYLGGSIEGFSNIMNEKANNLGLKSTNFVTPHGLDDENNYTTAYELALITDYALENDTFRKIVGTNDYTVTINGYPKNISNTNELLGNLNGVYGVKTGFTGNAGRCLVTSARRDSGLDIITIVLGADTKKIRTQDSAKLINYCFDNYALINIEEKIKEKYGYFKTYIEPNIYIYKGISNNLETYLSSVKYLVYPVKNIYKDNVHITIENIDYIEAPVTEDFPIGKISVFINNEFIFSCDILARTDIERKTTLYFFKNFLKNYKLIW